MATPLFVLSSGRCGSTLFQRLLNATEQCVIWGEHGGFLGPIAASYFSATEQPLVRTNLFEGKAVANQASSIAILKNRERWADQSAVEAWDNWFDEKEFTDAYRRLLRHLFCPTLEPLKYWGFKEIRYGKSDRVGEFLKRIFPKSTFVILVREPVANIASQIQAGHGKQSVEDRASNWVQQNGKFLKFSERNDGHVLKFEDLTEPGNSALQTLFNSLGLSFTKEHEDIQVTKVNAARSKAPDVLSREERRVILEITHPVRLRLGYL